MKIENDEQLKDHLFEQLRSRSIDWLAEYAAWRAKKRIPDAERYNSQHVGDFVGYQLIGDEYEQYKWKGVR